MLAIAAANIATKVAPTQTHPAAPVGASLLAMPFACWRCCRLSSFALMQPARTPHGTDLRKGRFSEPGRIYLVTAVTRARRALFDELQPARALINELRTCDATGRTHTLAFVIMPDHFHWLVQLEAAELSAVMQRVKSRTAIRLNRLADTAGRPVWQHGFHDHALRREEDLRATARYVIANPVRAGLVASVGAYPHWDAAWL